LVDADKGNLAAVNTTINELGGPNAQVSQTPVLLANDQGDVGTASLLQVKDAAGQTHLVDSDGAKYTDFQDYLNHNRLDDSWTITHPANLGDPGASAQQLVTGPAHVDTPLQQAGKVGDAIAGPMVTLGGGLVVGAGIATLASGGVAAPATGTAAAAGELMMAAGGGWIAARGGGDLFDRYQHGRSIDVTDPQARADMLNVAAGVTGVGGAAAGFWGRSALAKALNGTTYGLAGASVADQGVSLHNDWSRLTTAQRLQGLGQIAGTVGLAAIPRAGRVLAGRGSDEQFPLTEATAPSPSRPGGDLVPVGDFASEHRAFEHYAKHVKGTVVKVNSPSKAADPDKNPDVPEFGGFSAYKSGARAFMGAGAGPGVMEGIKPNGDLARFDPRTGYFGTRSPKGVIRTFFRPGGSSEDKLQYYKDQFKSKGGSK
jgi:hypothetical protein